MIRLAFIAVCFLVVFLVGYLTIWKHVIRPMINKENEEANKGKEKNEPNNGTKVE